MTDESVANKWVNVKDACELLGFTHRKTFYILYGKENIIDKPVHKYTAGGRRLFNVDDLKRWYADLVEWGYIL